MKFRLANLFVFITIVAVFLGLRQTFLVGNLSTTSTRAHCLPPLFAMIFGVWSCVDAGRRRASPLLLLKIVGSAVLGAVFVAIALVSEFGETLRRIDYGDWPVLLPVVLTHAVYGLGIGVILLLARWLNQVMRGNRLETRA